MVNDLISDFLSRIKNAQEREEKNVVAPFSRMLLRLADILKEEGFIEGYDLVDEGENQKNISVNLKYINGEPAIRELKRVSKPGIRKYRGYREIKPIKNGLGIAIISTPKGVMTGDKAKKEKVGGEYLCEIF